MQISKLRLLTHIDFNFVEFKTFIVKFRVFLGWALIVLTGLLAVTQKTQADPLPPAADLPVYGKPSEGRIRVEPQGRGWLHPGIYWLQKDTPLAVLLKRAGAHHVTKEEDDILPWTVTVKRGGKNPVHFSLLEIESGEIKVTFVLDDGDIVNLDQASL